MICEGCHNEGLLKCAKCIDFGLSTRISRYCSRECQIGCYERHKVLHTFLKIIGTRHSDKRYSCGTTVALAQRLPSTLVINNKSLSVYFFGCKIGFECDHSPADFDMLKFLLDKLKMALFPTLEKLDVVFSGFNMDIGDTTVTQGNVSIRYIRSSCQSLCSSLTFSNAVCVLMNPGFSSYLNEWEEAINHLVGLNVPTICTG